MSNQLIGLLQSTAYFERKKLTSNVGAVVGSGKTAWMSPNRSAERTSIERSLGSVDVVFPAEN
jgi:hypothetical protein